MFSRWRTSKSRRRLTMKSWSAFRRPRSIRLTGTTCGERLTSCAWIPASARQRPHEWASIFRDGRSGRQDVKRFRPGDEVFGGRRGAFAEYDCPRGSGSGAQTPNVTFEQAASVPIAAIMLQALRDKGDSAGTEGADQRRVRWCRYVRVQIRHSVPRSPVYAARETWIWSGPRGGSRR